MISLVQPPVKDLFVHQILYQELIVVIVTICFESLKNKLRGLIIFRQYDIM
jgi:hypothetical protein